MWIAVRNRFRRLVENLQLEAEEIARGNSRAADVIGSLNRAYFGDTERTLGSYLVGSWGKETAISPSGDVDLYYIVPIEEFYRFDAYESNGQSALLADVREKLHVTFPQTIVSGDGQVVLIAFNKLPVIEIAPCVINANNEFVLPDSNNGGSWITADPEAERQVLDALERSCNFNIRPLIQMLKQWKKHCNVPLKSFYLELLASDFLASWKWREFDHYFYDWMLRDFFAFLLTKKNSYVFAPGTFEAMNIGDGWESKANMALTRALKACELEYLDQVTNAGIEWQKIFGEKVPAWTI